MIKKYYSFLTFFAVISWTHRSRFGDIPFIVMMKFDRCESVPCPRKFRCCCPLNWIPTIFCSSYAWYWIRMPMLLRLPDGMVPNMDAIAALPARCYCTKDGWKSCSACQSHCTKCGCQGCSACQSYCANVGTKAALLVIAIVSNVEAKAALLARWYCTNVDTKAALLARVFCDC